MHMFFWYISKKRLQVMVAVCKRHYRGGVPLTKCQTHSNWKSSWNELEWIGLSWYWVGVSWFILEYWISNGNKILDQLSPIGNSVGLSWFDLSELELVGYCFFQLEISPLNIFPFGNFIVQQNVQLEPILCAKKSNRVQLGLKWVGKKVQLNPIVSNWFCA